MRRFATFEEGFDYVRGIDQPAVVAILRGTRAEKAKLYPSGHAKILASGLCTYCLRERAMSGPHGLCPSCAEAEALTCVA